jgi:phosphoribosylanthranilate isomerase
MTAKIKICGLTRPQDIETINHLGVDLAGFVFYKPSPRHLSEDQAAGLASKCARHIERVVLLVDPDNDMLDAALACVSPHHIQLHGHETPERVAEIRARSHCQIIKALPVSSAEDIAKAQNYKGLANWFLFDARPPEDGLPGGNGETFDWTLLNAYDGAQPYLLAGGLRADNVAEALRITHAPMVDISSGVEAAPGEKDAELMSQFVTAVRAG